jgi:hypothetical protein
LKNTFITKWKYHNAKCHKLFYNEIDEENKYSIIEMAIMMELIKNVSMEGL